jgi:hypothetical protein
VIRALFSILVAVVALALLGPALVERQSATERVPAVFGTGAEPQPRRVDLIRLRACFSSWQPGTKRPECKRIRERRGGVETRLGTVKIPRR